MKIDPENVHKIENAVSWLLQGMDSPNLLEQATALEQVAQSLRIKAAANARSSDPLFWIEHAIRPR